MAKQRYDLWIVKEDTIRLISTNNKGKRCKKIAREIDLNQGEVILMTPISSEAYCPLLFRRREFGLKSDTEQT
jgi:hypothetical protein